MPCGRRGVFGERLIQNFRTTLHVKQCNANLRTKILDVGGFYSSKILSLRGGILMSIGISPESLSQAILAGRFLVGRLGVMPSGCRV